MSTQDSTYDQKVSLSVFSFSFWMIPGMHLLQFHLLQKPSYSFMLVWMPWTLTNGRAAMHGNLIVSFQTLA